MNINFSTAARVKLHALHIISSWELIPCLWLKIWANVRQAPQVEFSLSNRYVRGSLGILSQVEWTMRGPDSKEGWNSLQWLKFRLVFHLTRWRDVWIPCGGPRESCRSPPHLDMGNNILWHLERHKEFNASKDDDAWLFLKMYRNPNITVPTRKWNSVSCLTSRSVRIVLPSVV